MALRLLRISLLLLFCLSAKALTAQKKKGTQKLTDADRYQAERFFIEGEKHFILEDYAKAYQSFQQSLEVDPYNGACHYKIATILIENGEWDKALTHALMAMDFSPENPWYYEQAAGIYKRQTNFKKAAEVYEQLIREVDASEENFHALAEMHLYLRDYDEAIATYEWAEESLGIQERIVFKKQQIYLKQNKVGEAIAEGKRLVENFPGETAFRIALARLQQNNGFEAEGTATLEEAHRLDPENEEVQFMLADIFVSAEEWAKAAPYLKATFGSQSIGMDAKVQIVGQLIVEGYLDTQADLIGELVSTMLETDPENASVLALSGDVLYAQGKKEDAIAAYVKSTRFNGGNFIVWQNILRMEFEMGKYADAVTHSEEALEYFPNQGVLYLLNGSAHFNTGNYAAAAGSLEQAYTLAGNAGMKSDIQAQLGDAWYEQGESGKAFAAYEKALEDNPSNPHALNNYSYYLSLRKEDLDKALQMSQKLVSVAGDEATYLDTHGWVLYQNGDYKEALQYLQEAVEKGGKSAEIYNHLGDALFQNGKVTEAVEYWKKAKALDATIDGIDKKIAEKKLYEN